MRFLNRFVLWLFAALLAAGCVDAAGRPLDPWALRAAFTCPVTQPNGATPPGERPSSGYHGNGALWTALWPGGVVHIPAQNVQGDGRLSMKWPWWRGAEGALTITGWRLDAPAAPLAASIPDGYGVTGFQATGLLFASPGCWEVTGHVGGPASDKMSRALTFITLVVADAAPAPAR